MTAFIFPSKNRQQATRKRINSGDTINLNGSQYEAQNVSRKDSIIKEGDVYRFRVYPGDDVLEGERSEFSQQLPDYAHGDDILVSYQVKIGTFLNNADWISLGQWHGGDNEGYSPYAAVILNHNDLEFHYREGLNQIIEEKVIIPNVIRNQWLNIVIRTVTDATNGILQVWVNNKPKINYTGPFGYTQQTLAGYWKWGVYRQDDTSVAQAEFKYVDVQVQ